eukprot:GHVS01060757.1.p1 GENE.GHVS01060757.1~~GHVS01060757.1.p1  ORF type:complete len:555 (+),score=33.98 GHVS01060757.1:100-1764(+)
MAAGTCVGGQLLSPWIGLFLLLVVHLLEDQQIEAVLDAKFHWVSGIKIIDEEINQELHVSANRLYGFIRFLPSDAAEGQTALLGVVARFPYNRDASWLKVQNTHLWNLFSSFADQAIPVEASAFPGVVSGPWAVSVGRYALAKGVLIPIGEVPSQRGVLTMWPIFDGFTYSVAKPVSIGAPADPIQWTADNKLALANDLVTSASYLHQVDLAHFQFSLDEIYGGRQEENPKFLPSSFGNLTQYGEVVRVLGCTPGEMWQRVDDKFDLYQMGVLLSSISAPMENSCGQIASFDQLRENVLGDADAQTLSDYLGSQLAPHHKALSVMVTEFMYWLNIARFSRPFLFGEDLMFSREDGQKLGDDNKSRLHIFCTLALIGDENLRPNLIDASWYLRTRDVTALLAVDVPKFLVPYSHSVSEMVIAVKPNLSIWHIMNIVANKLVKLDTEWNGAEGEKLHLRERIDNYATKVHEMLKTDFVKQIVITRNRWLMRALLEVHTFSFLFADFLGYLEVRHLKSVLPVGGLSEDGKKEFAGIPRKDRVFGPCFEIVDKLCKSR